MSFLTTVLAETAVLAEVEHAALPMPTFVYGLIGLVLFAALAAVVWSYRDVANRHQAKAKAYADAHGGARSGH
ncbi:hypothetical protein E3T24_07260 [Cryobacterium sp. TmT2-59]|uniref:4-hydroxybenzoate polyprenyltransferase n=1 Tax=Cryobacterium shii TaxID=1259235 RepID=A0AAQ2C4S4_9MICO|nr:MULTISPECIES: hypothetical protein [Cryobacterium]TFC43610.1 hypothetical protein E3O49_12640 [Cryobacterium shii]TFC85983.1 hypothetical protein E3T24_07260 [Cryobacterium sp. TmT2-59]TFD19760.1 hypothetical protein E3T32_10135 [Cryobacterium sp. TMT2-23]